MTIWVLIFETTEYVSREVRTFDDYELAQLAMQFHLEDFCQEHDIDEDSSGFGSDWGRVEYGRHTLTWEIYKTEVEA